MITVPKIHKDYVAVLAQADTDGVAKPSYEVRLAQSAQIMQYDSIGAWRGSSESDFFYEFLHDGDEAFSLYNWVNPATYKLTIEGTLTFTENDGIKGDGSTGYMKTGFLASSSGATKFRELNARIMYDVKDNVAEDKSVGGMNGTGMANNYVTSNPRNPSNNFVARLNCASTGVNATVANSDGSGVFIAERTSDGNVAMDRNGTNLTVVAQTFGALNLLYEFYLFARNNQGTATDFTSRTLRCWSIGMSFTSLRQQVAQIRMRYVNAFSYLIT